LLQARFFEPVLKAGLISFSKKVRSWNEEADKLTMGGTIHSLWNLITVPLILT